MSRTILITGATSGFGKACAIRFAGNGWRLILVGRRKERLDQLDTDLASQTAVLKIPLDVRNRTEVLEKFQSLPPDFNEVDVLVNNAGLARGLLPAPECDLDDWDNMIDTNVKGLTYCTRAILPGMVSRNSGLIVNIGSVAGNWPYPGGNVYGATKAFVQQFSRNLRADLLGKNIRVTNIEPGIAKTEFSVVRFKGDWAQADKVYKNTEPLRAEDIAGIIWWLANLPEHVNINQLEVMPTMQAWGPLAIARKS
ncbi:MAG TPA: SDR family oxidoreductase [Candidatus Marinimicrobia bacterium]|nr:SDR family oxidoreductase [Candidatus Neomarinimicrobiota bacterium]